MSDGGLLLHRHVAVTLQRVVHRSQWLIGILLHLHLPQLQRRALLRGGGPLPPPLLGITGHSNSHNIMISTCFQLHAHLIEPRLILCTSSITLGVALLLAVHLWRFNILQLYLMLFLN